MGHESTEAGTQVMRLSIAAVLAVYDVWVQYRLQLYNLDSSQLDFLGRRS